jgi:hypothetical protein
MRCGLARGWQVVPFATAFVLLSGSAVPAKNLKAIAEFVIPAYTAMDFAIACAQDDPWFLADASGPRGHAIKYAEHVKGEAIASLSEEESIAVLTMAADEARSIARAEFRKVIPHQTYRYQEIVGWCRGDALRFVRDFIERHDREHPLLIQRLEKAKQ